MGSIIFLKFKMAAATILDSGHEAFLDIVHVLLSEVATSQLNLVKIRRKMNGKHQYFKIQDGGCRHVRLLLQGVFVISDELLFKVATFLPILVKCSAITALIIF